MIVLLSLFVFAKTDRCALLLSINSAVCVDKIDEGVCCRKYMCGVRFV